VAAVDIGRPLVLLGVLVSLAGCQGENPVRPQATIDVSGTWDARFEGTVQGRGASQIDRFVIELQQSGSSVTGALRFTGLDVTIPVSGEVKGTTTLIYTARATLAPGCEGVVRAQATLDRAATTFGGSQTQSTCEGTAVGQVSGTRR